MTNQWPNDETARQFFDTDQSPATGKMVETAAEADTVLRRDPAQEVEPLQSENELLSQMAQQFFLN